MLQALHYHQFTISRDCLWFMQNRWFQGKVTVTVLLWVRCASIPRPPTMHMFGARSSTFPKTHTKCFSCWASSFLLASVSHQLVTVNVVIVCRLARKPHGQIERPNPTGVCTYDHHITWHLASARSTNSKYIACEIKPHCCWGKTRVSRSSPMDDSANPAVQCWTHR